MSGRPCIGVTSSLGGGRFMWWFYWLSLSLTLMGGRPVRLVAPVADLDVQRFDGLVIGGGDDIGSEHYQGEPTLDVRIDTARDALELKLLQKAAPLGIPVLGVCRGARMLNVFHGGSLHRDLRMVYAGMPKMWTPLPRKYVQLTEGTALAKIMGLETLKVNSLHNQAVDRLGKGLRVAGRDEFGVIQAIEDQSARFRIGVQWHPEFLIYRRRHRRLFASFVEAVRAYAAARGKVASAAARS
jgi:putative glutamine amidotransferase